MAIEAAERGGAPRQQPVGLSQALHNTPTVVVAEDDVRLGNGLVGQVRGQQGIASKQLHARAAQTVQAEALQHSAHTHVPKHVLQVLGESSILGPTSNFRWRNSCSPDPAKGCSANTGTGLAWAHGGTGTPKGNAVHEAVQHRRGQKAPVLHNFHTTDSAAGEQGQRNREVPACNSGVRNRESALI